MLLRQQALQHPFPKIMQRNLIASIILSAALFLGVGFGFAQYDTLIQIQDAVSQREQLLLDRQKALQSLRSFEQAHVAASSDIQRLDVFLPQKQKNDELISSIYAAAIESGAAIRDVSFGTPQPADSPRLIKTPIAISLTSGYGSLARFLASLETSLRLYNVTDVTISNSGGGSGFSFDKNLDISIKLNAFHLP